MSSKESEVQHTQHAFLVVWGWFTERIGLIRRLETQKRLVQQAQERLEEAGQQKQARQQQLDELVS